MLIVIDPLKKLYLRYIGRNLTHKAEADVLLIAAEVEEFRVNPDSAIVEEDNAS